MAILNNGKLIDRRCQKNDKDQKKEGSSLF